MNKDDMILISVDDHTVEPPDMFKNHLPQKYLDAAPRLFEMGFAAILVEHDLDFVRDISSRIVVLHQGRLVLDGSVDEVVNSEIVKTIYSGGENA